MLLHPMQNTELEQPNHWSRWAVVVVFATAMAYLESAVVLYLRTLGDRLEPYQPNPLPPAIDFGSAELLREAATIVMLAMVGWLAGRSLRARFGYFLVAFGMWDIFYYVFLKPLTGWPRTLLDWDVLFLIPLPWWGPVIAPMCIAALMVTYGTLLSQCERKGEGPSLGWNVRLAGGAGLALALYAFMADAIRVAPEGKRALQDMLPARFNWPLFIAALLLMTAPILSTGREMLRRRRQAASVQPDH